MEKILCEDVYPGNTAAYERLLGRKKRGDLTGFTGAGVSIPLAPSWTGLLSKMVAEARSDGSLLASEEQDLLAQIDTDPLETAQILEEKCGTEIFRSRLSEIFDFKGDCTPTHELIVGLHLQGLVTLNYDQGLSVAYTRATHRLPRVFRSDETFEIAKWFHSDDFSSDALPILHWHGSFSAPDRLIFTSEDYGKFYSAPENIRNIEEVWKNRRLLIVGFGWSDPFLTRIADNLLRNAPIEARHFAIVGVPDQSVSTLRRQTFVKRYRAEPIFYQIDQEASDGGHRKLTQILAALADEGKGQAEDEHYVEVAEHLVESTAAVDERVKAAKNELEAGLFLTPEGVPLYVEPELSEPSTFEGGQLAQGAITSVEDVAQSDKSYLIACPHEYGGSTLAKRLRYEIALRGNESCLESSGGLPNYSAKLKSHKIFDSTNGATLILDDFHPVEHERLINELSKSGHFSRFILICGTGSSGFSTIEEAELPFSHVHLLLDQLGRSSIRRFATLLYDTRDNDLISSAVEKTYSDLLELCIPLTPANVLMYLRVIYREGAFIPLNRLQITDRYIRELLQRPSDIYSETLSVDHKIDILAEFVYNLFDKGLTAFTERDWADFCRNEMARSLSDFDHEELFRDLRRSRFIYNFKGVYYFKFKLFYAYFVGQYIVQRKELLHAEIASGRHIALDGLVEVVAGLSKDNTALCTDLIQRLETANADFYASYQLRNIDPYRLLEWVSDEKEQGEVWTPIADELANGPAPDDKVDKLKRSIVAEQRTVDQTVMIREFSEIEQTASFNQAKLIQALVESRNLSGELKLRAMDAIYETYKINMRVGVVFAPIIATRKYFVWNNMAFVNNLNYDVNSDGDLEKKTQKVLSAMPMAVVTNAANKIGTKSLGEVFKSVSKDRNDGDFLSYLNFSCLIRSKPNNWDVFAIDKISKTDRKALYLRYKLLSAMAQFRQEVNTGRDRAKLKRIVASVQAKRIFGKENPSNAMIAKAEVAMDEEAFLEEDSSVDKYEK
ncbi:SIR2 family protein [Pontixanthobacter sp. CEM42]|uniref:SIR2 family protein n=1 Tax=Pontixanthobacter sp. CEM42 TaxID=2792077 RepID=UPI001AE056CF|nr:SIR2 family protein [Pontixanthobacter sp. CEM42]